MEQGDGEHDIPTTEAVRALVQAFEDGAGEGVAKGETWAKRKGTVHFLASVFANISMVSGVGSSGCSQCQLLTLPCRQLPSTRPLLLLPFPTFPEPINEETVSSEDEPLLTKIVVYTEHPDTIRRGGALGCIK